MAAGIAVLVVELPLFGKRPPLVKLLENPADGFCAYCRW